MDGEPEKLPFDPSIVRQAFVHWEQHLDFVFSHVEEVMEKLGKIQPYQMTEEENRHVKAWAQWLQSDEGLSFLQKHAQED